MKHHIMSLHLIIENEKNELRKQLLEENPKITIFEMEQAVEQYGKKCLKDLEKSSKGIVTLEAIDELRRQIEDYFEKRNMHLVI